MIKLTSENTVNAIAKCKQLRPRVSFIADRTFSVQSANNANSYTVRFDVQNGEKFGLCECLASKKSRICYHIIGAATVNIYRQSLKRQVA